MRSLFDREVRDGRLNRVSGERGVVWWFSPNPEVLTCREGNFLARERRIMAIVGMIHARAMTATTPDIQVWQ
jgi:hypothetical protein